jgi:RNA polymerase sigma factor (sigma-70 family)
MRDDSMLVSVFNSGGAEAQSAWDEICDKYRNLVFHVVNEDFPSLREEAEDLAQEVFMRLYKSLSILEIGPCENLKPVLKTYLKNLCIDALRRRGRSKTIDGEPENLRPDGGANYEQSIFKREVFECLRRSLDLLGETCRQLISERIFVETSYEELAARLGGTHGALRQKLNECKKSWMKMYSRIGGPELEDGW